MRAFTQSAADPVVAQAKFLLAENPQRTQALRNAQSPEEGHRLMADAWKFAGYNRSGGENAARLATTQAYANSFAGGQTLPGVSAPRGGSMGSTAQAGGFGLNGVQSLGSAVPGQASPAPGVASLSGQPLTVAPEPTGFSSDATAKQQPASPYSAINNAFRSIGGGQQRPAQGQGQQKSAGMKLGQSYKPQTIGLQQAQAMFDPGRFYGVLRNAGVRGV